MFKVEYDRLNRAIIPEFIYRYVDELKSTNGSYTKDVVRGLKDIDYNMYMFLIGENISDTKRIEREQFFYTVLLDDDFTNNYTYVEPKFIAKIQSDNCMIYLYRTDENKIRVGDRADYFNEDYKKYHLTRKEIERKDVQFIPFMKPVGGYWWQKDVKK